MSRRYSHCAAKLVTSDSERGSASIRRTCCSSTFGSFSRPAAAASSSSSSGMLLQMKKDRREASSRSETRYAVPAADVRGLTLDAEEELRADEQPLERLLDAEVEAAFFASALVERQQVPDVRLGHRAAVRAARERGKNPARTGSSSAADARPADEDAPPARRIAGAGDVVGTADRHAVDGRLRAAAAHAGAKRRLVARFGALHERDTNQLRAGLQRQRKLQRTDRSASTPTTGTSAARTAEPAAPTEPAASTGPAPLPGTAGRSTDGGVGSGSDGSG